MFPELLFIYRDDLWNLKPGQEARLDQAFGVTSGVHFRNNAPKGGTVRVSE